MRSLFVVLSLALFAPCAASAATVHLDAKRDAGMLRLDAAGGFYLNRQNRSGEPADSYAIHTLTLEAGAYEIRALDDQFTAWRRWRKVKGCDAAGANCRQGYEVNFAWFLPETATSRNDAARVNWSKNNAGGFFATPDLAFADVAGRVLESFTLTRAQKVAFYIHDTLIRDNSGGVSLDVTKAAASAAAPVPGPLPAALLGGGLGLLTLLRRRR